MMKTVFSYKEIEDKYHILAPIERDGKKILICSNKKNSCYAFFVDNFSFYEKVSDSLRKELSKVYKRSTSGIYTINLEINTELTETEKENTIPAIIKNYNECKEMILKHFAPRNEQLRELLSKRLDSVKVVVDKELKMGTEYYNSNEHAIHITTHTGISFMLHELTHAASFKGDDVGYGKMYYNAAKNFGVYSCEGMTEGATQYNTEVAMGNRETPKIPCGYRHTMNLYHNLIKGLDSELEQECFLTDKGDLLKKSLVKYFKLETDELVEKLFNQIDLVCCIEKQLVPEFKNDYISIITSAYKTLIEMYVIKLTAENTFKELDEFLSFKFLIPSETRDIKSDYDATIRKRLENYFEEIGPYNYKKEDQSDINEHLMKFINTCANCKPCTINDLPKYCRNTDFFVTAINNVYSNDAETIVANIIETLLDPKNGFVPNDEKGRKQFLKILMGKSNTKRINVVRLIPPKQIKFFVEDKDPEKYGENVLYICAKDPIYFFDVLHRDFNPSIINSGAFINGFYRICSNIKNIKEIKPVFEKFKNVMQNEYHSHYDFDFMGKEIDAVIEDKIEYKNRSKE